MQIDRVVYYGSAGNVFSTERKNSLRDFRPRQNNQIKFLASFSEKSVEARKGRAVNIFDAELLHSFGIRRQVLQVVGKEGNLKAEVLEDKQQAQHAKRTRVLVRTKNSSVPHECA